jgi:hypothetical protein
VLSIKSSAGIDPLLVAGCTTSDVLELTSEFAEITNPSDDWVSVIPTYLSGSINFDSVIFFVGVGYTNQPTSVFLDGLMLKQKFDFSMRFTGTDSFFTFAIEGECYVQSINITGAVDAWATGNISLLPTGTIQTVA